MFKSVICIIICLCLYFVINAFNAEVVIPQRVTFDGRFVSYSLNSDIHIRKIRSANANDIKNSHFVHYYLPSNTYGNLVLSLSPNSRLLAPAFVVEKWHKENSFKHANTKGIKKYLNHTKFCYYEGFVQNISNTLVSLSTCDGLRGIIRINYDDLIVEPLLPHIKDVNVRPHKITKRSIDFADQYEDDFNSGSCGNSDDIMSGIKLRKRWEERRRNRKRYFVKKNRLKRSVSVERNVETLIVADQLMVNYYTNEDLEMYILTVMNVVSSLYHDASIGNAINIVMVRVILLQNEAQIFNFTSHSLANVTLKTFCHWQKHINPREEHHPNHHDAAVLITRNKICSHQDDRCNTLGLAEIAGMCQPLRSCAVTEDTGLSLAYTIAHELGHNFGMSHDGPHNGCLRPKGKNHIMAPNLNVDASPSIWSNCSRTEITKFLDRDWGYCLDDEPSEHEFTYPQLPPGTMYNADHQCRLQYGTDAQYCHEMEDVDICQTLWCKDDGQCISKLKPAAEGTICGKNKWCHIGKCVIIGERPGAINGEWGQWSEWSLCSRSCGAGIMVSERDCNNPRPSFGGRYCIGERKRYKVCNTEPCHSNQSFRAEQCSAFDSVPFKGEIYKWQPVFMQISPCQLHCKPEGKSFSVMLSDAVTDGTPCHPGTRNMCINGKCRSIACDWGLDSDAQEDRCGVCHGDGTGCITHRNNFTQKTGFGYVQILTVPEGARNLRIEESFDDTNYFALMDSKGEYFLNGDYMIDWTGEYISSGVTFYYDRDQNGRDKLHAPGRVTNYIKVMLLFQGENRGIKWEYTVADLNASRSPEFEWVYEEYDVCSRTCGGGVQLSRVRCYEKEAGLVEDQYCLKKSAKPSDMKRVCNIHNCPARWWTGQWQHCNATCANDGIRKRSVLCVRSVGNDEEVALLNTHCDANTKPKDIETCKHHKPCPQLANEISDTDTLNVNCTQTANCKV